MRLLPIWCDPQKLRRDPEHQPRAVETSRIESSDLEASSHPELRACELSMWIESGPT